MKQSQVFSNVREVFARVDDVQHLGLSHPHWLLEVQCPGLDVLPGLVSPGLTSVEDNIYAECVCDLRTDSLKGPLINSISAFHYASVGFNLYSMPCIYSLLRKYWNGKANPFVFSIC